MNEEHPACVFKKCPNVGETKLSLTTGPMHNIEDKEIADGSIVFWVCRDHAHADIGSLAVSWDDQRVLWQPNEPTTTPGVMQER